MNKRIYLSPPHMGGSELKYVQEAFDENWIAPLGPNVDGFENELANYNNSPYVAALSSGTAAIHLALIMLGVEAGDEVICSTFTFSASANPIVYQGAIPIFVDGEADTWNISPEALEDAIKARIAKGKKPKAIILVHLYGVPAKMEELMAISKKYDIPIIEDAAEALGSTYKGQKLGTFGEIGIYSFNGNKIITTSGGGALVSENENYVKQARFLATQARDNAPHYQHSQIGYNYRMSNIVAGIGRGQLKILDKHIAHRREIFDAYKKQFSDVFVFVEEPEHCFSNRWLTTILVNPERCNGKTREDIRLALEKENIEARPLWKPMHQQPIFEKYPHYGNKLSEELFEIGLCLPSGSQMVEEDLALIFSTIQKTIA